MKVKEYSIKDEDVQVLLNDLIEIYGYDFSDYAMASLKRRINRLLLVDKLPSFAELRYKIREDKHYLDHFIEEITVNVTEMFRDPSFFRALREKVFPQLATYPFIKIWHAGCSTGEEVYSMAIMLEEAGLLHKSLLYATDLNHEVLEKARKGIFPMKYMQLYSENYIGAGGANDFSSYYTAGYDRVKFDERLSARMVFATHNLVSDRAFNHFHLVVCRNVLIYFNKTLQNRVLELFCESLEPLGYLALGSKETLKFSKVEKAFKAVDSKEKIWRKIIK
jgi:chemotaxis protein methyltransferase CheR